jgi:hypothetical protein
MGSAEWIDADGAFTKGKHRGRLVEDIAAEEPSYLRWILDAVEGLDEEDRALLTGYVDLRGHLRGGRR